ncbi:MAG: outer membrane lipoprotein-sorting protein, partial [Myxococcota bacterium]
MSGSRAPAFTSIALLLSGLAAAPAAPAEGDGARAERVVNAAFERRYSCAVTGVVEIETSKGEMRALKRRIHIAAKFLDGRLHTYAVFREPQYVRGMTFLGVESEDPNRSEQQFVYLPSMKKIRRVSGSQPTDSFLGTDLSYHDFQRQHPGRYRPLGVTEGTLDGEPVLRARAEPLFDAPYLLVRYTIAESDQAILATDYYKRIPDGPYKRMRMPRTHIVSGERCAVPTLIHVEDDQRGTRTQLVIKELRLDAPIDDALFTTAALEKRR